MGCADVGTVVHLCSGSVAGRFTFDLRERLRPAVVADVRWLPIRRASVRWIMADPPYSVEHAEALWQVGKKYPTPAVLMRECAEVLAPGGRVAFLHFVVPRLPAELERIATYGVTIGPGYRIRALTIAERVGAQRIPGLDG
jgi:SAM-dependent methyltransferase